MATTQQQFTFTGTATMHPIERQFSFDGPEELHHASAQEFHGYPEAKAHVYPYTPSESPKNPVLRGAALKASAVMLPLIPGLPSLFYRNAGWSKLRYTEGIREVDATYDPIVIPLRPIIQCNSVAYTDPAQLQLMPSRKTWAFHSIADYHKAYKSGKTTPTEVVEALLPIILRDGDNPTHHSKAWLDSNVGLIRTAAAESTKRWKAGSALGIMDGVPIGAKDEADVKGYYKKNMGSKMHWNDPSDSTSWCVLKWEEAGAILMGKTNMHEIGMDTSNNNPNHGTPINPYNVSYYPGGSSGGSASAVAAGIIPFALGCDGGGSIRLPASWCGIYGLKTTHGWVSTRPYKTPARSTSVAGPMAATMLDLEVAWRVMAQPDPDCAISSQFPLPTKSQLASPRRIGIYRDWFERADPEVKQKCQDAIDYYTTKLGYELVSITIPHIKEAQMAHALTILNEANMTLTKPEIKQLTPPNQILITVGRSASVIDFLAAQRLRTLVMEHVAHLFKTHPGLIIVTPTTPNAGWPIHKKDLKYGCSNGNQSIRNMEYVWLANFTGCPSISVPVGYVDPLQGSGQFPVGLMGMAEWGAEEQLISFGYESEEWLKDGLKGGRVKPNDWVDVMGLLGVPRTKKNVRAAGTA